VVANWQNSILRHTEVFHLVRHRDRITEAKIPFGDDVKDVLDATIYGLRRPGTRAIVWTEGAPDLVGNHQSESDRKQKRPRVPGRFMNLWCARHGREYSHDPIEMGSNDRSQILAGDPRLVQRCLLPS
jgi:hypothetical protein